MMMNKQRLETFLSSNDKECGKTKNAIFKHELNAFNELLGVKR